jgi:hypothetical protein
MVASGDERFGFRPYLIVTNFGVSRRIHSGVAESCCNRG